jgi:hypothetical protein
MFELTGIIRGPINPEDVMPIPGSPWVITSGMTGPTAPLGRLYGIDTRDLSCAEIFPWDGDFKADEYYGPFEGALDPAVFEPHGIDVAIGPDGQPRLYVVNHGGKESVEIFRVHLSGPKPRLTWIGSLTLPVGIWGNDLVQSDKGGVIVSSSFDISEGMEKGQLDMAAGLPNGAVAEWAPGEGWTILEGGALNSPNGVALSTDGGWVYLAGWRSKCLRKFSRGTTPVEIHEAPCDVMIDNITWSADGKSILATGVYDTPMETFAEAFWAGDARVRFPTRVWRFDAETLESELIAEYGPDDYGVATTAVEIGDEIWLGCMRFDGVARLTRRALGA